MATTKIRIEKLEQQVRHHGPDVGWVFPSMEAAAAAGATGGVLIIPTVMGAEEWCEMARMQQAELVRDTTLLMGVVHSSRQWLSVEQLKLLRPSR